MKGGWVLPAALIISGCQSEAQQAAPVRDWCEEFYDRFDPSEHIDERTGKLKHSSLTEQESDCIRREAEKAVGAFEGELNNGDAPRQ
jgi:hypothetical protein